MQRISNLPRTRLNNLLFRISHVMFIYPTLDWNYTLPSWWALIAKVISIIVTFCTPATYHWNKIKIQAWLGFRWESACVSGAVCNQTERGGEQRRGWNRGYEHKVKTAELGNKRLQSSVDVRVWQKRAGWPQIWTIRIASAGEGSCVHHIRPVRSPVSGLIRVIKRPLRALLPRWFFSPVLRKMDDNGSEGEAGIVPAHRTTDGWSRILLLQITPLIFFGHDQDLCLVRLSSLYSRS